MANLQDIAKKGTEAVKRLRKEKLAKGIPFMINSEELPTYQCYLEYPDGSIQLGSLAKGARDFDVIRELNSQEIKSLREKFNLD